MLLGVYYDGVEIHREDKIIYARFLAPHLVISTCRMAGGIRDDLTHLYNHQSCEPKGHQRPVHGLATSDPAAYHRAARAGSGLPETGCAALGTAANMRFAAIRRETFREIEVVAVCTGGVEGNAGRAGDPATVYEWDGAYERVGEREPVAHGTINTLIFINHELTHGAMVRTVMTATEAKTAALQELAVNSRYSDGLATGTGTDQIGAASRLHTGAPLTGAGKHCVLGELIGKTVHDAVRETLMLQNGLTPAGQRSATIHLERFGTSRAELAEAVAAHLGEADGDVVRRNFKVIERDPLVVAAVAALAHLRDKMTWGVLPESCAAEIWAAYGAQLAAAVSGDYSMMRAYMDALAEKRRAPGNAGLVELAAHAIALGFRDKWRDNPSGGEEA